MSTEGYRTVMSNFEKLGSDWKSMGDEGFAALIGGVEQEASDPTRYRFRFRTGPKHANRNGFVHGGLLMTLADHAMGISARQGDHTLSHATISFTTQFVAAVKPGAVLELECRVIRARRTMIFMDGVMTADGEVVASCTGVWRRFDHRK